MGTQSGVLRIEGKVGELSFFKSRDGYVVRKSEGNIDGKHIKTDSGYRRTRENMAEFGRGAKSARLLRTALRSYIPKNSTRTISSRLIRLMLAILHTDVTHGRGDRTVAAGDLSKLLGFRFNESRSLKATLKNDAFSAVDRVAGTFAVTIPSLKSGDVLIPPNATHFRIRAMAVEADFDRQKYVLGKAEGELISVKNLQTAEELLVAPFTQGSSLPIIGVIGIQFVKVVQDEQHALSSSEFTAMDIVLVNTTVRI